MLSSKDSLVVLRKTKALLEGHFVLSSGLHSPTYVQCAKLLSFPNLASKICISLSKKIKKQIGNFDLIIAPAIGGIVIGYEIGRLLKKETIESFVDEFLNQDEENLFGVVEQKDYFWDSKGKLITPWPEDQTIMNTKAVDVTYKAAHVLYASRMDLISDYKFMGDFDKEGGIKLFQMNGLEAFDIDEQWQFEVGELLYEKFIKKN